MYVKRVYYKLGRNLRRLSQVRSIIFNTLISKNPRGFAPTAAHASSYTIRISQKKNRDSHLLRRREEEEEYHDLSQISRSSNVIFQSQLCDLPYANRARAPRSATIHYKSKLKIRSDCSECLYVRLRRRFTSKTILSTRVVNMTTLQRQPWTGNP